MLLLFLKYTSFSFLSLSLSIFILIILVILSFLLFSHMLHQLFLFSILILSLNIQFHYPFTHFQPQYFGSLSLFMTNEVHLILNSLKLYSFYLKLNFSFNFFYPNLKIFFMFINVNHPIHIHPQLIPESISLYYQPI